jgi:hypothetical protein
MTTMSRALFQIEPFPLILRKANTVVSWSPKSGCSHVVLWTFLHEGLFHACNYYHGWPHHFRLDVYYRSAGFQAALQKVLASEGTGQTLLKVTRDPKHRLVSIFRHVCRFPFLHQPVKDILGIDMRATGLSLADFDAVLGGLKLVIPTDVNPHVRAQRHPVWEMPFDRVITLNMDEIPLNDSLNAVERALGLTETNFARYAKFQNLRENHYAKETVYDGAAPIERYRFRPEETDAFPKRQIQASPLLERMARQHYAVDYGLVDSGDTAGELFRPEARTSVG